MKPTAPKPDGGKYGHLARAFADGMTDATGQPYAPPRIQAGDDFIRALNTHARGDELDADGKRKLLRGDDCVAWIRSTVAKFRRSNVPELNYWGGWTTRGFARWLNEGRPDVSARAPQKSNYQRPYGAQPAGQAVERFRKIGGGF